MARHHVRDLRAGYAIRFTGMSGSHGLVTEYRPATRAEVLDYEKRRTMHHGALYYVAVHYQDRKRPGSAEWGMDFTYVLDGNGIVYVD